jgi:hypothetical protein
MTTLLNALYYALPGIAVALAVRFVLVASFRGQRKWVVSVICFAIALLAALIMGWRTG